MKKLMNRIRPITLALIAGVMIVACLTRCKRDHLTYTTTSVVNMYSYLEQNNQFSMFKQIIDKSGYTGFLNGYGTYTMFAPDNDGVKAYLKATSKASVDDIDTATAKGLVGIAVIPDTLSTQYFTDGKLRTPTEQGQYIITGVVTTNGVTTTVINKQANLLQSNVRVGNGIIHVIDNVLVPAALTLAQTIEQNPRYSIFSEMLKATGFYDTLNHVPSTPINNRTYLTVIGESDSAFKAGGINDFAALKAKYSTKGDPMNPADSLWLFAAYHIWSELSFMSDISLSSSHVTLAPDEITTSEVQGPNILLNNDTFNGVLEPGQLLYRYNSDIEASNGVLHDVLETYSIKVRSPSPVYFDVCAQPEIMATPGVYRVNNAKKTPFTLGTLSNVYMEGTGKNGNGILYCTESTPVPSTDWYFNDDHLEANIRFRLGSLTLLEFTTPVIVKGTYKIWVDYKRSSGGVPIPTYFDGVLLPNTFNNADPLNGFESDAQAEARGFKSYSDSPIGKDTLNNAYNGHVGRLMGTVTIKTTDHHKIKMIGNACTGCSISFALDAIEFRPVDMDQIWPRLGHAGNLIPKP